MHCVRDKWVPVTTAWRILRLRMEEQPPKWRIATNILNKQSQSTRGGPPAWGLDKMLTTSHHKNVYCYEIFIQKASELD